LAVNNIDLEAQSGKRVAERRIAEERVAGGKVVKERIADRVDVECEF
jgi:hypothetical protein